MASINPVRLKWTAPTKNTDGTDIAGDLSYRLTVDGTVFLDFPGTLNPDGRFSESMDALGLSDGAHTLTLQSFYVSQPSLLSDPSNSLDIVLGVTRPDVPLDFSAG